VQRGLSTDAQRVRSDAERLEQAGELFRCDRLPGLPTSFSHTSAEAMRPAVPNNSLMSASNIGPIASDSPRRKRPGGSQHARWPVAADHLGDGEQRPHCRPLDSLGNFDAVIFGPPRCHPGEPVECIAFRG
jgi:hypothetical protein